MGLLFYYDLRSQPCRSVYLFLKANGIKYESKLIELPNGDHLKPDFLKVNPYHKVPVIDDSGMVMSESIAIMQYLASTLKVPEHWYPRSDERKRARMDEFLHWHHACVRRACIDVFLPTIRSRIPFAVTSIQPLDIEKISAAKSEVKRAVTHIADYFLQDKKFIVGNEISIADVVCLMELEQLYMVQENELYEGNEKVKAWAQRVRDYFKSYYDEVMERPRQLRQMFIDAKP